MASLGRGRGVVAWLAAMVVACLSVLAASPALAAEGSIDHVENKDGTLQVLYSVPGAEQTPDLSTVTLSLDGKTLDAEAQLASNGAVRRTTILAIDVSDSMAGTKFTAAKRAAEVFLASAPADLYVGIVTFAGKVRVLQRPSLDRATSKKLVDGLELSFGTYLYDGVIEAVRLSGVRGPRSVLVLSDGRDTSTTKLRTATDQIKALDVKVDVIAVAQTARDEQLLTPLSTAGKGNVISAADPEELGRIFATEAQALAGQVLVTAPLPPGSSTEGTLSLGVQVGAEQFTDAAFVTLAATEEPAKAGESGAATELAPATPGFQVTREAAFAGVLALGAGVLVLLVAIFGGLGKKEESIESRIQPYTTRGSSTRKSAPQAKTMTTQAVNVAQKALQGSHGFEAKLGGKLDAGGLTLKPAEWLLLHAAIALGVTALVFLLTGANVLLTGVGLLGGLLVPWLYLGRKQSRRLKAFNAQLAPTLQLLAGSMQAGLSIAQGMDTIVREGAEPVAGEFRRALVEARLGVQIEDSLDAMALRMMSADFKWTVMAIRIQREVGGNLAELLLNVAATLREREYLRRQVKSLSAEGRFSAYILLALPPGILLYEAATNPTYLAPLFAEPLGWVMLGAMGALMGIGAFSMSRLVKLEV